MFLKNENKSLRLLPWERKSFKNMLNGNINLERLGNRQLKIGHRVKA